MAEIEKLKRMIAQQTCAIVDGVKAELDKINIGGDSYQTTMVLDEVKKAHAIMFNKLSDITRNVNKRSGTLNKDPTFDAFSHVDDMEDGDNLDGENGVEDDVGDDRPRGLLISWKNNTDGSITLLYVSAVNANQLSVYVVLWGLVKTYTTISDDTS
eukprot:CAMPEP_0197827792 /NCGR_PEP_ID=MMETSP1437-20131217/4501_1 /TAXON_ID=49252 ORGANISM="Eucampia antarctica, Strain CCMP1452" /NCGR_SAMPLE_ID=MMETSP1437 /ASSEMBLY_ACC=CAM_ASM_001096 /LENGTH=155 /DNA_ID=CAMNT_0043428779 /DNA_START=188 /DNA_END=655 /DNA_ORIENTATION=-